VPDREAISGNRPGKIAAGRALAAVGLFGGEKGVKKGEKGGEKGDRRIFA